MAATAEAMAEQDHAAAWIGVGSKAILAAGVSSDELVDNLASMLGYPFDLVVPGGFQACSTAFWCTDALSAFVCSECIGNMDA